MQIAGVFLGLGEEQFAQLIRGISIGKLKTYQIYDAMKARTHVPKLNTEALRKATPRFLARLGEGDDEFARDLAQAVLVSHLDMITAVLDFVGLPHEGGFFAKDVDAKSILTEGWQQRVYEQFRGTYPESLLLFYVNHLAWELTDQQEPFLPAA